MRRNWDQFIIICRSENTYCQYRYYKIKFETMKNILFVFTVCLLMSIVLGKPVPTEQEQDEDAVPAETSDSPQNERYYSSHENLQDVGGMFADFGASTGDNGSFGWHAEFPINSGY